MVEIASAETRRVTDHAWISALEGAGDGRFELSLCTNERLVGMLTMTSTWQAFDQLLAVVPDPLARAGRLIPMREHFALDALRVDAGSQGPASLTIYGRDEQSERELPFPLFGAALRLHGDSCGRAVYYDVRGVPPSSVVECLQATGALEEKTGIRLAAFASVGWLQFVVLRPQGALSFAIAWPRLEGLLKVAAEVGIDPRSVGRRAARLGPLAYVGARLSCNPSFRLYGRPQRLRHAPTTIARLLQC